MNNNDITYLKIRSLIADKEMVTATANMNLSRGGEWLCDYSAWHAQIDQRIETLLEEQGKQNQPQPQTIALSECCEATAVVAGKPNSTQWYVCPQCCQPCDIFYQDIQTQPL